MKTTKTPVPAAMRDLIIRATVLFPLAPYLDPAAVRAARRGWIRAVQRMPAR